MLLHAASEFGVSVTPILAGLGVGGLAVALAIRPTLENIVGGFILFADKPVRVGETCSFGDQVGTVEAIGLRSTCIRTLDRTLLTAPNTDFAQLPIGNRTRRDMYLHWCRVGLRYETMPDQLRFVAARNRKLLIRHSKVSPDPARVRLVDFGRDQGIDVARGELAASEVDTWRRQKRLPFPEFDFAERAEMADTLPFPAEGSPDYRLVPAAADGAPDTGVDRQPTSPSASWFRRRAECAAAKPMATPP